MSQGAALRYLFLRSAFNRLRRQARRLREPRYAIALVAGLGYLLLLAGNNSRHTNATGPDPVLIQLAIAAGLLVIIGWSWISGSDRRALAFNTSEVLLLFPAPVTRRALVHLKLARAQLLILLNTVLWVFILRAGQATLPVLPRALSIWALFSTLQMHRLGAALTRASAVEHGRAGIRRQPVALAVVVLVVGLGIAALFQVSARLMAVPAGQPWHQTLTESLQAPLAVILLFPVRLVAHPVAAATTGAWLRAFPPALGIVVLHYLWVLHSDSAFEEAAAEASFERARLLAARRGGTRIAPTRQKHSRPLVALPAQGPPAGAIVWKNVAMLLRRSRLRAWGLIAFALALTLVIAAKGLPEAAHVVGIMLLVWGGFFLALGPQWVRNDLRSDLAHLDLLRSYPVEPDAVVRAEAISSAFVLTLAQLTLLLLGALALVNVPSRDWPLHRRLIAALATVIVLPALNYLGMLIQNGAALLFPAWVRVGQPRGGVESLGQNMLSAIAYLVLLMLGCVLPVVAAIGVTVPLERALGEWALLAGAGAAALLLVVEGWTASLWLGTVYARLDPPSIGLEAE